MGLLAAVLLLPVVTSMLWLGPGAFVWLVTRRASSSERAVSYFAFLAGRLLIATLIFVPIRVFDPTLALWLAIIAAIIIVVVVPLLLVAAIVRALIVTEGSPYRNFWKWAQPVPLMMALLVLMSFPITAHWQMERARESNLRARHAGQRR